MGQTKNNDDEGFWQDELTVRPFLLNQLLAAPVVIEQDKAYVGGKGVSNTGGGIIDFLLRQAVLENVVLLEIKTPATSLLQHSTYRAGVYGPSDELGGGIARLRRIDSRFSRSSTHSAAPSHLRRSTLAACF